MTIRAPYQVLHGRPFKKYCFEREVIFEAPGACWPKNASKRTYADLLVNYLLTHPTGFLAGKKTKYHWRDFMTLAKDELVEKVGSLLSSFRSNFKVDFS